MKPGSEIAAVLPPSEHFTHEAAGALALFAWEAARDSVFKEKITVYGGAEAKARPLPDVKFRGLAPKMELLFGRNGGFARALAHQFKERMPGLIEVHNRVQIFNILAKHFPNVPMAMHFHNDPLSIAGTETPKERWALLSRADAIYCCSDYIRRRFLTGLEAGRTDHVHVVYHGIDPVKTGRKENVILYAGRLIAEKGALELAKAAAIVLPHFPEWKIAFVGANRHGGTNATPYARAVIDAVAPLGKQAVFLGHRPHSNVMKLFAKASIAVVPSIWNEPLGRTGIEALATGCALITSGHGGLAEIAGDAGVIVSPVSPEGLALALQGLMENPDTLRRVQQQGVARAPHFSLQNVQQHLDMLRQGLLEQNISG